MQYSIDAFRAYARGLDERLADVDASPDAWIDARIEEGISLAQDIKPVFSKTEVFDMTTVVANGTNILEINLTEEIHSVYEVLCDVNYFSYVIHPDNSITITANQYAKDAIDKTAIVRYFYYPVNPLTTFNISLEVFKFLKAAIASNCYSMLSDEKNETLYLNKARDIANTGTFDIEKDLNAMKQSRLWDRCFA